MTYTEVNTMIESVGVPSAYYQFTLSPTLALVWVKGLRYDC